MQGQREEEVQEGWGIWRGPCTEGRWQERVKCSRGAKTSLTWRSVGLLNQYLLRNCEWHGVPATGVILLLFSFHTAESQVALNKFLQKTHTPKY